MPFFQFRKHNAVSFTAVKLMLIFRFPFFSGVATSSCTDSSTGSSEDVEPASPFSPQSSLSEDHHQQQKTQNVNSSNKMSPQTTILTTPNAAVGTTSSLTTTSSTSASSVVSSLNAALRTSNLPASLTITPTNGCGGNANKGKVPITQITKSSNTANTSRCSNLPTLQWPWSTTATATTSVSALPPSSSAPAYSSSSSAAPTSTTGTNTHITHSSAVTTTTNATNQAKKRIASYANSGASDMATTAKKARSNTNATQQDNHHGHVVSAAGAKRLKAAALEESQTKITGYFKSQMKAQIHAANNKTTPSIHSMSNTNIMMTTTTATSANHNNSTMTTNALTMSAPATTASLNKYFNILAQLKENSKATNNTANGSTQSAGTIPPAPLPPTSQATTAAPLAPMPTMMTPTVSTASFNTSGVTITTTKTQNINVNPMPMPALKKIERPKPTKIAQVAPNLRKTPSTNHAYVNSTTGTTKKHVAIAPRTPEMKQQQQQMTNKQESSKQTPVVNTQATTGQSSTTTSSSASQPPAVLLTAIRLPHGQSNQQSNTQTKAGMATNKIASTPPVVATTTGNNPVAVATSSHSATPASAPATTLYQLPTVQLPNLVQLPQLLAANGANLMHLNNMANAATVAKNVASTTTASTTTAAATSAQAAQAAAAQYFLNGTVFKLQQFTTATTTTATTASTANVNPFNLLSASDLQDLLIKQQQQQLQQLQQQQQKAAVAANATSFQEIFQQQIAAAIAANQQQQQQQAQLQQLQRLGAAANMQQQPVFMATPAGLLLNAASLPAMLAQAAAALAVNTQQQQQQQQQKTIALPALQPIQQAPLPALSSIFAPPPTATNDHQQDMQQHQHLAAQLALAQQQQQFITATQPPPLSSVALTTNTANLTHNSTNINSNSGANVTNISNSNLSGQATTTLSSSNNTTAKLAIVKANATPVTFTTLSSQPPPLVTISNAKSRTHMASTNSCSNVNSISQKPSIMAKPYQKRSPKAQSGQQVKTSTASAGTTTTKTNVGKITTASGKIIATPTTPPPLVPTMTTAVQQPVALTSIPAPGIRATTATNLTKTLQIPTPALVSIAPTNVTPIAPKPAQSITCGSVTISPANTSTSTLKNLVNIAPKVNTSTTQTFKYNNKTTSSYMPGVISTSILSSNNVGKTKTTVAKSTASDLFDLVKNSNGAISITPTAPIPPLPVTTIASTMNSHNFNAPLNFSTSSSSTTSLSNNTFKAALPSESFGKIKDEPMDMDMPVNSKANTYSCSAATITGAPISNVADNKEALQSETPTSFSGQIPTSNIHIKEELMNSPSPATAEEEEEVTTTTEKTISHQPNNLNHECSSSSFSSNSNSISSAADLSLEASTPASITSNSEAPSPACSILSPLNTSNNEFATPNPCSNSVVDSNSCETQGGASSRDMLSEMVTSTCISSDSSEASSISVSLPENEDGKQARDGLKSNDDHEDKQRDLPTPESGIGGSLSNTESMDSSSKSSTSDASSSSSTSSEQVLSPTSVDLQTPPATPMNIDSSYNNSMEETQNNSTPSQTSTQQSEDSSEKSSFNFLATTIDTNLTDVTSPEVTKCALSPILSQPKTIRFPVMGKGNKRHDGVCYWDKCNKKHDSNSKLLDHMQQQHVNSQTGPFSCLWVGCKVYNKESCSRRWLERHVLSHGGSKQLKCIVEGCGLRFGSQVFHKEIIFIIKRKTKIFIFQL